MSWEDFIEQFMNSDLRVVIEETNEFEVLCERLEESGLMSFNADTIYKDATETMDYYPYLGIDPSTEGFVDCFKMWSNKVVYASEIYILDYKRIISEAETLLGEV